MLALLSDYQGGKHRWKFFGASFSGSISDLSTLPAMHASYPVVVFLFAKNR